MRFWKNVSSLLQMLIVLTSEMLFVLTSEIEIVLLEFVDFFLHFIVLIRYFILLDIERYISMNCLCVY